jgi:hypothetical protein
MQKVRKKKNTRKGKRQEYNSFDDFSFWLSLATTDFSFGLSEKEKDLKKESDEHKFVSRTTEKE